MQQAVSTIVDRGLKSQKDFLVCLFVLADGKCNQMQKTFPIFEKRMVVENISLKQQHAAGILKA